MKLELLWDDQALVDLERLELAIRKRIVSKIEMLAGRFTFHEVRRLQGTDTYRLRIGDYRAIFVVRGRSLMILKVAHRKRVY